MKLAQESFEQAGIYEEEAELLFPRRKLIIRKKGKRQESLAPIFPGYLFLQSDSVPPRLHWAIRRIPGFIRFLETNQNVRPLVGRDRELLLHFLQFGEVVERSQVTFDENKRIQVVSGPLKGLEGLIVRVDKRKGRAKIRLDMYKDSFLVDLGFEIIEPSRKEP
jgi:transcriptional antiterminator NusG